jgi:hypothetical protein
MEVITHYPSTPEGVAELDRRVAQLHAQMVANSINRLHCPPGQKLKLIDAIRETVLECSEKAGG